MESGNEEERGGERRKEKRNHHPKAYDFFSASAASYGNLSHLLSRCKVCAKISRSLPGIVDTAELLHAHNQFCASSKLYFHAKTSTLNHPYILNEEEGNFGDKVTGVERDQAPYGDVRLISE